jgi:hypothetical protein
MQDFLLREIVRAVVRPASGATTVQLLLCKNIFMQENITDSSCTQSPLIAGGGDFLENLRASKLVKNFYGFLQGA